VRPGNQSEKGLLPTLAFEFVGDNDARDVLDEVELALCTDYEHLTVSARGLAVFGVSFAERSLIASNTISLVSPEGRPTSVLLT
jgi:hypothetical protein